MTAVTETTVAISLGTMVLSGCLISSWPLLESKVLFISSGNSFLKSGIFVFANTPKVFSSFTSPLSSLLKPTLCDMLQCSPFKGERRVHCMCKSHSQSVHNHILLAGKS